MSKTNKKILPKSLTSKQIIWPLCSLSLLSICFAIMFRVLTVLSEKKQELTDLICQTNSVIDLSSNNKLLIQGNFRGASHQCFIFTANSSQTIEIDSQLKVYLSKPNQEITSGQGLFTENLLDSGEYVLHANKNNEMNNFEIKISLLNKDKGTKDTSLIKKSPSMDKNFKGHINSSISLNPQDWGYNVLTSPPFKTSENIQEVVNKILDLADQKGLPSSHISISLIDLNSSPCCLYGLHKDKEPRFPASIAKLFWMVAFFGELEAGKNDSYLISEENLYKMIQNSDNEPASDVLDWLTDTQSGSNLSKDELNIWKNKRDSVNRFFRKANYQYVNISQKNFPVPKLKLLKPEGRELQIRGNQSNPLRNSLTTYETARLLYEINTRQSVSQDSSRKMQDLLRRDYEKEKLKEYDSIKGFLGERLLSSKIKLYSKAGWTSDSRQDAAVVVSHDGKTKYILVIFGDDPAFANDWDFFPDASLIVYENMRR